MLLLIPHNMDLDLDTHVPPNYLIYVVEHLAKDMDSQKQIDMIFLDFSKAFDTAPHQRLLTKLQYYGINNKIYHIIRLEQKLLRNFMLMHCLSRQITVTIGNCSRFDFLFENANPLTYKYELLLMLVSF